MRPLAFAVPLLASAVISPALAQPAGPTETAGSASAPVADGDTAMPSPSASAKPIVPATGYWYGAPTAPKPERPRARAGHGNTASIDALMAGFETLADGSTRVFVELSKPTPYDTKAAGSTLTYILKSARVDRRNNENPLVTVHFNTPVASARLVPHGRDLWLVVDLRAAVQPTASMDSAKDGAATLRIDFPKGDYLQASGRARTPVVSPSVSGAAATPPPAVASSDKTAP